MKNIILIFLLFIFSASCGQTNINETDKLATTAKVWGFLKYYHPEIGKGTFNWDDQLFTILPQIEKAGNKQELSKIYLDWIDSLGEINECTKCTSKKNSSYFGKNFDLKWIEDSEMFSDKLIAKLKFIEKNRFQGNHYYASTFEGAGNVKIQNEFEYANLDWKDKKLRLLSLFQYWNYIEYFFPYKYQMDQDWDITLKKALPNFVNSTSETAYHLALLELMVALDDSHAYLSTIPLKKYFGKKRIPGKYHIIDDKVIITQFYNEELAKKDDIQIGDAILAVNGKSIATILSENNKYIPASNPAVKLRDAYGKIFNDDSSVVKIKYERNGMIEEKRIQLYPFKEFNYTKPIVEKWKFLNENVGYVNMGVLEKTDVEMVMDTLFNTKAIIFDVRNYPKGTMYQIANYLNENKKEFVKAVVPDLTYPGKFNWTQSYSCGTKNKNAYKGKVIVLVNETTQSHAEFTVMCLQTAKNAVIIGNQTSGADGNVSIIKILNKLNTYFTGIGIFYPDGKETQRIGIVPDIYIKPTITGIRSGKDEVLDKAIQIALE